MLKSIKGWIGRRGLFILLVLAVLFIGWWWTTGENGLIDHVVVVQRGELVQDVSISGRVVPAAEVDLAFKESGRVEAVLARAGQSVGAGQILIKLEADDETRAVEAARIALANAELDLERLLSPIDQQVEEEKLEQAYEEGLAAAAAIYDELSTTIDGLDGILFEEDFNTDEDNIEYYAKVVDLYNPDLANLPKQVTVAYRQLKIDYLSAFEAYRMATRGGSAVVREQAIFLTDDLARDALNIIKSSLNLVQFFRDRSLADGWVSSRSDLVDGHLSDLSAQFNSLNADWLDLTDVVSTIKSQRSAVTVSGLDTRAQELEISRQRTLLADAEKRLAEMTLRAAFAGTITNVTTEVGEIVSVNEPVVSLISADNLEIESYVPEINIATLEHGDLAAVTLDAYGENIFFDSQVIAIDPAETIRDGVSTYKITLRFNERDERIRPGMTANIVVATERKSDVLLVPAGALVERAGETLVRVTKNGAVAERVVETGATSSFGEVEIVSGLEAGEQILVPNGTSN